MFGQSIPSRTSDLLGRLDHPRSKIGFDFFRRLPELVLVAVKDFLQVVGGQLLELFVKVAAGFRRG